jgi:hypothetical protein
MYSSKSSFSFGSDGDGVALEINENLRGSSYFCKTFNNKVLHGNNLSN